MLNRLGTPHVRKSGRHVTRVLLIDDHAMFRSGLRKHFETQPDMELIGDSSDIDSVARLTCELKPDILLLDLAFPRSAGMEVLKELTDSPSQTKTIILTASIERTEIIEAIKLGACGVVLKESTVEFLFKAIRCVMSGQYWVDRGRISDIAQTLYSLMREPPNPPRRVGFGITPREREIIAAVLSGYSNKDIAVKLSISDQTVKNHLTSIFDKMRVSSRLELVLCATKNKLFDEAV